MADYVASLKNDLVEQFRGKTNIESLTEVIGIELQAVYEFFEQLKAARDLSSAAGRQLDGVGDIAVLSRMEAGKIADIRSPNEIIDDNSYRKYLIYKIMKNTCDCTYPDIIKAFKMFWDKPLFYSETPEKPATVTFSTEVFPPGNPPDRLINIPIIKAAGVSVEIFFRTKMNVSKELCLGSGASVVYQAKVEQQSGGNVHKREVLQSSTPVLENTCFEVFSDVYPFLRSKGLVSTGVAITTMQVATIKVCLANDNEHFIRESTACAVLEMSHHLIRGGIGRGKNY